MQNKVPRILIIPARRHIIEAYTEYLIRYLSDEFYFEMGYPPEEVYYNSIGENVWKGATSPLEKNPHDYDLIYPHFATHWYLEPPEEFASKVAIVLLDSFPKFPDKIAVWGATSKQIGMNLNYFCYDLRFGIDTDLFKPIKMVRIDDDFHIGTIGNIQTPRRYMKEIFMPLGDLPDSRLVIYPSVWYKHTRPDEIELMGGQSVIDSIVDGDRWYPGLPNIYNQMDVFVRPDIDVGYHFPVMEAAACGVPVVCCDSGNNKELCDAGGGICIDAKDRDLDRIAKEFRKAVEDLRINRTERIKMGVAARKFIEENYTWDKFIPTWRDFFRKGVANAQKM